MRYYISDLHFFHKGMNDKMDCRGFASVEEMNETMLRKWNEKVNRGDEVVILGDLSFGTAKETNELLKQLNGKLYMIYGNHDRYINSHGFDSYRFRWIKPYAEMSDNGRKVVLSHYPIFCYNGQYKTDAEGNPTTYMLYGHVHNSYDEVLINQFIHIIWQSKRQLMGKEGLHHIPCSMINCFCMFSDYTPLSLDEWIEVDRARREKLTRDVEAGCYTCTGAEDTDIEELEGGEYGRENFGENNGEAFGDNSGAVFGENNGEITGGNDYE